MDTQRLREKAEHMRVLAWLITDDRTRLAALNLATDYERQATEAEHCGAAIDGAAVQAAGLAPSVT
jgi:hypothetical protein